MGGKCILILVLTTERKISMKIENNYTNFKTNNNQQYLPRFGYAYLDVRSLNTIYQNKPIINALKEQNTSLRKFIKDVINTKIFENNMGDCLIKISHDRFPVEGLVFAETDIIQFLFPKKIEQARKILTDQVEQTRFSQKETVNNALKSQAKNLIPLQAEKEGSFCTMFDDGSSMLDYEYDPTHKELADYIKSDKIVKDLKKRIEYMASDI